jgi:hypothetical protein
MNTKNPSLRSPSMRHEPGNPRHSLSGEGGTVLIMAMVILLILTIIGVTALNTTTLEAKMAGNTQDTIRAFEAAESGLNKALNTTGSLDLYATDGISNDFTFTGGTNAKVNSKFLSFAPPKRGSGYSIINYDSANFDQASTGFIGNITSPNAKSVVHQGVSQIVNKSQ